MTDEFPVRVSVPEGKLTGTYANFAAVWHSPHEFTLDFAVADMEAQTPEGESFVPVNVVARIKVPPSVIFDIARAIAENVDKYERQFGAIKKPGVAE